MKAKIVGMQTEMVGIPYSYGGEYKRHHFGLEAVSTIDFVCLDEFGGEFKIKLEGKRIFSLSPDNDYEIEIRIKETPKVKAREFVLK